LYVSGGGDPQSLEIRDYTIKIGRNSETVGISKTACLHLAGGTGENAMRITNI
jgi:hypothetical protein